MQLVCVTLSIRMTFVMTRSEPHVVEFLNVLTPKLLSLKTCTSTIIIRSNKCVFFKSVFNQLGGKVNFSFFHHSTPIGHFLSVQKGYATFEILKLKSTRRSPAQYRDQIQKKCQYTICLEQRKMEKICKQGKITYY